MTSFEGLCEILAREYQRAPETLSPQTPLEELSIDSLGIVELIFAIEEKFNVTASEADTGTAQHFKTLQDVSDYVDRLIAERDAPMQSADAAAAAIASGTAPKPK